MVKHIYCIIYSLLVLVSFIYPSDGFGLVMVCVIFTIFLYIFNMAVPSLYNPPFRPTPFAVRALFSFRGGTEKLIVSFVFLAALIPARISSWTVVLWIGYFAAIAFSYIVPLFKYIYRRACLFSDLQRTSKEKGCRVSVKFRDLLLLGKRNIFYFTARTDEHIYTFGILGAVGRMRYIIADETITSQNVNAILNEKIIEAERDDFKFIKACLKLINGRKYTFPMQKADACDDIYLIVPPNAFIEHNGAVAKHGQSLGNLHLTDIEHAAEFIR